MSDAAQSLAERKLARRVVADGAARPVGRRIAYALGVAAGLLYFFGFAGTDVWPCALVALAPMAIAFEGQPARRCLEVGAIAGFTMNMLGFYWLYGMLKTFSGFPGPLCVVFMSLLCAYQGGRIGLFGWLCGRARARGWPPTLTFLLAFAASVSLSVTSAPASPYAPRFFPG